MKTNVFVNSNERLNSWTTFTVILFITGILFPSQIFPQSERDLVNEKKVDDKYVNINKAQASSNGITFFNGTNPLLDITPEYDAGAIRLYDVQGGLSDPTNKLYNINGDLFWNNIQLGTSGGAVDINDLSDAIYDGNDLFLGENAGTNNNSQYKTNTGVGKNVLTNNTGYSNTGFGNSALEDNTSGNSNTGVGALSLQRNTTGSNNSAFGNNALRNNTIGSDNTAVGKSSLSDNVDGNSNSALGVRSLFKNSSGSSLTAGGFEALRSNTSGDNNTAFGASALWSNTTGVNNTAMGYYALRSNTTGYENTANGAFSLRYNNVGYQNTANGFEALFNNTSGFGNTAIGAYSLRNNLIGEYGTAVGYRALYSNLSGDKNTAVGSNALELNTTGYENTSVGYNSLKSNVSGHSNTAIGNAALERNTVGFKNTAFGEDALEFNIYGDYNTAVGANSGPANGSDALNNTTCIGYGATVTQSNRIRIGNDDVTQIGGIVGWSNLSDGRFKKNIKNDVPGIDFIMGLRPVTYNLDMDNLNTRNNRLLGKDGANEKVEILEKRRKKANKRYTGFIAQEVEELANSIGFEFSAISVPENENDTYSLRYAEFVVPIVKAIQEQEELMLKLEQEISELKARKQNN